MEGMRFQDLGTMPYKQCWEYQQRLFHSDADTILMVEHPPVYTLGKSGKRENMLLDEARLQALGAEFYHIDRGGDITFHGPGQLVVYPILNLTRLGMGVREYIHSLEQAVIATVAEFGIEGGRIEGASGVWVTKEDPFVIKSPQMQGGRQSEDGSVLDVHDRPNDETNAAGVVISPQKICALGVKVSRGVTMHGLALNVATDLRWFEYINPCGFSDRGVTSMEKELGREINMEEVKKILKNKIIKQYAHREKMGGEAAGGPGGGGIVGHRARDLTCIG